MKLIDVHAHLDMPEFVHDLDAVLERARQAGVVAVITNGTDRDSNRKVLELAEKHDIVRPALGLYPVDALKKEIVSMDMAKDMGFDVDEELAFIEKNINDVAALGEVGLDFSDSNEEERRVQKEIFLRVIELSENSGKAMLIHSRKAEKEVIDMLESSRVKKAVLHCFSGSKSLVNRATDLGFYFSIPANIARADHFQSNVKKIDISRLFTETDAPWLAPERGERNEPANVAVTVKKIAELKGMDAEEVANNIFYNYQKLFL